MRSGNTQSLLNAPEALKTMRVTFHSSQTFGVRWDQAGHKYGLTITIPSSYWYMQNFDIVAIEKKIDWFNVMTYNPHGTWDSS